MTLAGKKVVYHRLSALELAKALGNVSDACRRRGITVSHPARARRAKWRVRPTPRGPSRSSRWPKRMFDATIWGHTAGVTACGTPGDG